MSVTVEQADGIRRTAKVIADAKRVTEEYNKRLVKVSKTANVDGFRKGKVPVQIIQQRFGKAILDEVASEIVTAELDQHIKDNDIKFAGHANILEHKVSKEDGAEFVFEFEVYPEIEAKSFAGTELEVPVCEVKDSDVDAMLEKLSKQHGEWKAVDRVSENGDQIEFDFEGFIDDVAFEGGKAANFKLELGSGQMIPGFEDGLIGAKKGQELDLKVTFPAEYQQKDLAGKDAVFKCKVHSVNALELPAIDDELAKKFEVEGGIAALKEQVRTNMQSQVTQALEQKTKDAVFEKLLSMYEFGLPQEMVKQEMEFLAKDMQNRLQQQYGAGNKMPDLNFPIEMFADQAKTRVKTGLLLAELVKHESIKLDNAKLDEYINNLAVSYDDKDEFAKWYKSDKNMMARAESHVIEQQLVDKLILDAKLKSKSYDYQELIDSMNNN